jgi:hypothetical protein
VSDKGQQSDQSEEDRERQPERSVRGTFVLQFPLQIFVKTDLVTIRHE